MLIQYLHLKGKSISVDIMSVEKNISAADYDDSHQNASDNLYTNTPASATPAYLIEYYASLDIYYTAYRVDGIINYINFFLLGSFVIVVGYDLMLKNSSTRRSFFIISFVNILLNFIWSTLNMLEVEDDSWMASVIFIIVGTAYIFDGWILFILALNRFSALVYPVIYRKMWSNRNTIIIITLVFLGAMTFKIIFKYVPTIRLTFEVESIIIASVNVLSSICGFILSIVCILKSNGSTHESKHKADRKLALTSLCLAIFHILCDTTQIIFNGFGPARYALTFGYIAYSVHYFVYILASFVPIGGIMILLCITR